MLKRDIGVVVGTASVEVVAVIANFGIEVEVKIEEGRGTVGVQIGKGGVEVETKRGLRVRRFRTFQSTLSHFIYTPEKYQILLPSVVLCNWKI